MVGKEIQTTMLLYYVGFTVGFVSRLVMGIRGIRIWFKWAISYKYTFL